MLQVFGTRHSVPRRRTAIASTMVRSTMLRLAVTALLAVVASAQPGVGLFAEGAEQDATVYDWAARGPRVFDVCTCAEIVALCEWICLNFCLWCAWVI